VQVHPLEDLGRYAFVDAVFETADSVALELRGFFALDSERWCARYTVGDTPPDPHRAVAQLGPGQQLRGFADVESTVETLE